MPGRPNQMLGRVLTSKTVRRLVANMPRGRSITARIISRRYPSANELLETLNNLGWSTMAIDGGPARDGTDIVCRRPDADSPSVVTPWVGC